MNCEMLLIVIVGYSIEHDTCLLLAVVLKLLIVDIKKNILIICIQHHAMNRKKNSFIIIKIQIVINVSLQNKIK